MDWIVGDYVRPPYYLTMYAPQFAECVARLKMFDVAYAIDRQTDEYATLTVFRLSLLIRRNQTEAD